MQQQPSHTITSSFVVAGSDLNATASLHLCRLLAITREHTDAAITHLTGSLDFDRLQVVHYHLEIVGSARLSDVVRFRSHAYLSAAGGIEILLSATRQAGGRQEPILDGSFVFTVRREEPVGSLVC